MQTLENILVFKTDIETEKKLKILQPILNNHPTISEWSVDQEDIDNVLRIEARKNVKENDILLLIRSAGFNGEPLPD